MEARTGIRADLDGDGRVELLYIDGDRKVKAVDENGSRQTLDGSEDAGDTRFGVGDRDEDGTTEVVYMRDERLYQAAVGEGTTQLSVSGGNNKALAVAGVTDFTVDGSNETVYVDDNNRLRYVTATGNQQTVGTGPGVAVGTGNAIGSPADYDDDGDPEVPYYDDDDGANKDITFAEDSGEEFTATIVSAEVRATPMAALDVTGDGVPDVVYVDNNNRLRYVSVNGGSVSAGGYLVDDGGDRLTARGDQGVV